MRTLLLACLATLALCAACGQKGPLVLPQKSVATPVVIRAPAAEATPSDPAAAADRPPTAERRDDEKQPPTPKR